MFELFDSVSETKDVQRVLHFHDFKLAGWVLIHRGTNSQLLNCTVMVMWDACSDPIQVQVWCGPPLGHSELHVCTAAGTHLNSVTLCGTAPSRAAENPTRQGVANMHDAHWPCQSTCRGGATGPANQNRLLLPPFYPPQQSQKRVVLISENCVWSDRSRSDDNRKTKSTTERKQHKSGKKSNTKREQLNRKMQ